MASAPTEARLVEALTSTAPAGAVNAFTTAVKADHTKAWELARERSPIHQVSDRNPLTIDLDATVIIAHSEDKDGASGIWKGTYGHHPLLVFVDYGAKATGEPLAFLQRTGTAGSNTAKDHTQLSAMVVNALPSNHPRGKKILFRTDTAGCTYEYLSWLTAPGRGYQLSVTYAETVPTKAAVEALPKKAWDVTGDDHGRKQTKRHVAEIPC
ncbi:transposase [Glutamicibacter sp. NPDC087344]|uniref:transposase n=1 Tax=Glutamicibacter sp. NPDC087344 TaxID=3363994 RepID=UPI0038250354